MNYQNIPRSNLDVKKAFVPKQDAFLCFDYKNIEPRMAAYYMAIPPIRDEKMAQVFRDGHDIYSALAASVLGIHDRKLTDEERQVGKVLNLAILYSGGAPTIMRKLGVDFEEASKIKNKFHAEWPGVKRLEAELTVRLQERGYITTLWGRHLHPLFPRLAINRLVSGGSADLMKAALVRVDEAMVAEQMESHMVSVIHDEIIIDAVEAEIPWLVENVPALMGDERVQSVVPIDVDIEISRTNWAEKEEYEAANAQRNS